MKIELSTAQTIANLLPGNWSVYYPVPDSQEYVFFKDNGNGFIVEMQVDNRNKDKPRFVFSYRIPRWDGKGNLCSNGHPVAPLYDEKGKRIESFNISLFVESSPTRISNLIQKRIVDKGLDHYNVVIGILKEKQKSAQNKKTVGERIAAAFGLTYHEKYGTILFNGGSVQLYSEHSADFKISLGDVEKMEKLAKFIKEELS